VNPEALRARLFLRALLPLLPIAVERRPHLAVAGSQTVQFDGGSQAAHLEFGGARLEVRAGPAPRPTLRFRFRDEAALAAFFAGRPALPRIAGLAAHPLLAARVLRLLASLRILSADPGRVAPADRALRVELMLCLATRALSQLARAGDPEVTALVGASPERVYQWTVADTGTGAYLRMERGRTRAGRGIYTRRRPFVSYTFPTTDAAFRVLTARGSQMASVARGDVIPEGSPEYSRTISRLLQRVDQLLTES
jgi:hypothetical protein